MEPHAAPPPRTEAPGLSPTSTPPTSAGAEEGDAAAVFLSELRTVSLFSDVDPEEAEWLRGESTHVELQPQEWLGHEGEPAAFYLILQGELRITKTVGGVETLVSVFRAGEFFGEVPLLLGQRFLASSRALSYCRLVRLSHKAFWQMLAECPTANREILRKMAERMKALQSISLQQEKLASLGTLAAGLAHELNNPVSAVMRGVRELGERLGELPSLALSLDCRTLSEPQVRALEARASLEPVSRSPLDRGDAEDALARWLGARGVEDAWVLAPELVESGLSLERLEHELESLQGDVLKGTLRWVAATRGISVLLEEVGQAGGRIAALVNAARAYTYLDEAPLQRVDVHEGLESTLAVLGHRLRGVRVERDYDRSLPPITAYGTELNQVWTSLIENAADAIKENGGGTLLLRTRGDGDHVEVEVVDDGPGIPEDVLPRVFDPFFTTKGVGEGTGLGLSITHRVVSTLHRGEVVVTSRPGETRFRVRLPLELDSAFIPEPARPRAPSPQPRPELEELRGA
ncbi:cyclic nucleotide-binding domain-containing protein [Myxococcus sp. CA056]|uniref:sensor histidine kinase n=1 Tax=unclassified Myxococcus TaxID=2648731 RepID=UPI00157A371A|nr:MULTISPECIES: ATP-binding protein [unclassified Myxococcus]NTX11471.1 cyclic nucleotide-binding domain-containing protein [Myxococcus sp. CA056]NTX34430.1 cyclic nucleotide-binding domain-containing protein [Myxococcus sp. CA033]